jgi:hypothetical protein
MEMLHLLGSVGLGGCNCTSDVEKVQLRLKALGLYERNCTLFCDDYMVRGIMRYQSQFTRTPNGLIEPFDRTCSQLAGWGCLSYTADAHAKMAMTALPPDPRLLYKKDPALRGKLNALLNKTVTDFCSVNFHDKTLNHCAHFVSHVLNIRVGMLCDLKNNTHAKSNINAVSIRVNDIYNSLSNRGKWKDKPSLDDGLLVFATISSNVSGNVMSDNPKKHVGILCDGNVYHYANIPDVIRADKVSFFEKIYQKNTELFYGVL